MKHELNYQIIFQYLYLGYINSRNTFIGIRDFNYAKNWEEFRDASRLFDVPAQFMYADVDGNIAYQSPRKLPIRAEGLVGDLPILLA